MMRTRTLMLLATLVTVSLVAALTVWSAAGHHGVRRPAAGAGSVARAPSSRALDVLHRWDRRRAAAWARGDPRGLAALYVRGSAAGRRDVAMLAAYRSRGLTVRWMRRQVLAVHVRRSTRRRLSLVVTDRLVDGTVVRAGLRTALPQSRPATHTIDLRREARRWRVVEVYPRRPSPAASTAEMSGSRNS